uniref:Cytochrome c oxidase subunit 5B, mitochondrial n=1 Tax=Anas platyrhynchos platyrhynchos TaxID=8840 RepID=A0A493T687_ANAPP
MASRLLRVSAALRLLPAATARAAPVRHLAAPGERGRGGNRERELGVREGGGGEAAGSRSDGAPHPAGGLASDQEQATGLERKVLEAMNKGLVSGGRAAFCPPPPGEEDNSCVIWFWLHKGEAQRCPSCGAHYKLIPHELPH